MQCDNRKVSIIGLGNVGSTLAYTLLVQSIADELVLVSRSVEKAIGEQLDLEHGLPVMGHARIRATADYAEMAGSDIIIVTAGQAQKPGETRMDLAQSNKAIFSQIAQDIKPHIGAAVIVVVGNPVDVLTYQMAMELQLPEGRVLGTGTLLDTARFRFHMSEFLHVHPQSIHAYILGEHGETAFPVLSSASIGGQLLSGFADYTEEKALDAFQKTKDAAQKIIQAKGATYYGISAVCSSLVQKILQDQRSVLPVSAPINGYYGQSQVAVSIPCIIGRNGVAQQLNLELSEAEQAAFAHSCEVIRSYSQ